GFRAINNLTFAIGAAELRAIIGPNGAGKSTFMDIVTGKTRPDSGTVTFGEKSVSLLKLSEAQIARAGIGRKFQRPTVFEDQTVEENLTLALKAARSPWAVLAWRKSAGDEARIAALADQVGLSGSLGKKAGILSHGQKQWLEIAMLLAQDPSLLLVDEPVAGMTDSETEATAELLKDINRDHSVIVVEHDMGFVRALGCRVMCLHEGAVLAEGSIDAVASNPRVIEVYLGR
ncbi:MAG: urea ABC transporter ATP-binding protein UrtD, partial [Hyphomicrobiales bacterium]|nr:urea ABC transporter ATP-binding protein UrtD [Hyphomicrobiales bacterium]